MKLRAATTADTELLLEWRNDPDTRASSLSTDVVPMVQHVAWLTESLANQARRIHIAAICDIPVGVVIEEDVGDETELQWIVSPQWRCKYIGAQMVRMAAFDIRKPIIAKIKIDNVASMKIALIAGMSIVGGHDLVVIFRRHGTG